MKKALILMSYAVLSFLFAFGISLFCGCSADIQGNISALITQTTYAYRVGGTVSGLTGTVVLQNNEADDLSISINGAFTFPAKLADGDSYTVTIETQPEGQFCALSGNTGTIAGECVKNVSVVCEPKNRPSLQTIVVTPSNRNIHIGSWQQLNAQGVYSDRTTRNLTAEVTWSSSKEDIAVISNTAGSQGMVRSLATGSTVISAVSGSISGETMLTVYDGYLPCNGERAIAKVPAAPNRSFITARVLEIEPSTDETILRLYIIKSENVGNEINGVEANTEIKAHTASPILGLEVNDKITAYAEFRGDECWSAWFVENIAEVQDTSDSVH